MLSVRGACEGAERLQEGGQRKQYDRQGGLKAGQGEGRGEGDCAKEPVPQGFQQGRQGDEGQTAQPSAANAPARGTKPPRKSTQQRPEGEKPHGATRQDAQSPGKNPTFRAPFRPDLPAQQTEQPRQKGWGRAAQGERRRLESFQQDTQSHRNKAARAAHGPSSSKAVMRKTCCNRSRSAAGVMFPAQVSPPGSSSREVTVPMSSPEG